MTAHEITIVLRDRHGETWYQAVCTCGYRSGLCGYSGRAERAGADHVKAKAGGK